MRSAKFVTPHSFRYFVLQPERHCLSAAASVNTSRLEGWRLAGDEGISQQVCNSPPSRSVRACLPNARSSGSLVRMDDSSLTDMQRRRLLRHIWSQFVNESSRFSRSSVCWPTETRSLGEQQELTEIATGIAFQKNAVPGSAGNG